MYQKIKLLQLNAKQYNYIKYIIIFLIISFSFIFFYYGFDSIINKKIDSELNLTHVVATYEQIEHLHQLNEKLNGFLGIFTPITPLGGIVLFIALFHSPLNVLLAIVIIIINLLFIDIFWASFKIKNFFLEIFFKIFILLISSLLIEILVYKQPCSWNMVLNITPIDKVYNGLGDGGHSCWPIGYSF